MILPGIIYAYLFLVGMNYFSQSSSFFIEAIILKTGLKSWVDNLSSDLIGFFITMGSFWLWFTLLLFYFALFKYLFLFLFAPYFSYFHLRIEAINKNEVFIFNRRAYQKLLLRAWLLNVTNLLWQTVYLIPIVIICTLPIVGWFTPFFTIILECYFFGYAMLDYGLATEKQNKVALEKLAHDIQKNKNEMMSQLPTFFDNKNNLSDAIKVTRELNFIEKIEQHINDALIEIV